MRNPKVMKLHGEIGELVTGERLDLVEFLRKVDALDRERGYCEFNCGSTWEYLTKVWHLCEGTASARTTAMRLLRRFPRLEAELASGRLNPTQLLVLAPVLTPANFDELVGKAAWLSKRKTLEVVVAIQPRVVPADGVRRLPRASSLDAATATATVTDTVAASITDVAAVPVQVNSQHPDVVTAALVLTAPVSPPSSVALRRPDRGSIEPVAKDTFQFRAHMDDETKRLFDQLAEVVSHAIPDRAPAKLLAMMVRDSLEAQKRKRGLLRPKHARKPRPARAPTPGIRQPVAAEVRRQVLERDGNRCTITSHDGERCPVTEGLEMEHIEGALVTGSSTAEELRAGCKPHNGYLAVLKFGPEFIDGKIAAAREERDAKREAKGEDGVEGAGSETSDDDTPRDPVAGETVAEYGAAGPPAAAFAAAGSGEAASPACGRVGVSGPAATRRSRRRRACSATSRDRLARRGRRRGSRAAAGRGGSPAPRATP